jgi:hypothetical protein
LTWVDGVQALLADDLSNQLGGVRHDLVAENDPGAAGPDILGEMPFNYFVYKIEASRCRNISW